MFLKNKSSCVCWNPHEPLNFTVGNEDGNCYTFDMRKLDEIKLIHKDHVNAVLSIDFAPHGKEFVTGSFDKTLWIFPSYSGKSWEIYHTKRMQQVNSVVYSMDCQYVISGSEDTNLRIWKSEASKSIMPLNKRQKEKVAYSNALKWKFAHNSEVKRIMRHKHVPKLIKKLKERKHSKTESRHRKEDNIWANSKPGTLPYVPERKQKVVNVED